MTVTPSRGHGDRHHHLSPASSLLHLETPSLSSLSSNSPSSRSAPRTHRPLLCSGPLHLSFPCLGPSLLSTDRLFLFFGSLVTTRSAQQDSSSSVSEAPFPALPLLTLPCLLLSRLLPPSAWKSGTCVSSTDPSTCLGAWRTVGLGTCWVTLEAHRL